MGVGSIEWINVRDTNLLHGRSLKKKKEED